jgi:hypothetical protein
MESVVLVTQTTIISTCSESVTLNDRKFWEFFACRFRVFNRATEWWNISVNCFYTLIGFHISLFARQNIHTPLTKHNANRLLHSCSTPLLIPWHYSCTSLTCLRELRTSLFWSGPAIIWAYAARPLPALVRPGPSLILVRPGSTRFYK